MQTAKLARASNIVTWNKWFMTCMGLWPLNVNNFLYVFFTTYMIIYCSMAVRHLLKHFGQAESIIANLTDNIFLSMIIGKMFICRMSCKDMTKFLKAIKDDFTTHNYTSVQEEMAYLRYNELALIFTKYSMSISAFTATMYYLRTFIINWRQFLTGNFSYDELPYPVQPFFEIKDTTTYACVSAYLFITVPIIICGYAGADAYVLSMVLHICGQYAALAYKVDNLLRHQENYQRNIGNIVIKHRLLITLAEILEKNFTIIFLQQTLGTILLLCLTLFHMITNSEHGDNASVVAFILYTFCVSMTIFGYCYIGDCFINESAALRDAFYNTEWYNNPPSCTKLISICMVRAEKPMVLTAAKFFPLSLSTFTNIVKTSMAYLSILRNFM
ncbi:ObirOr5-Q1 [Ooceraea biroi]|uniref:Odorant receptor n=1 Tax=Ooceraea biroi TaxID=2015173 RepID=A0A3L8E228_OOCBI|nr:odorant receptor 22c [Ooceraea biroi]RLU26582.1 ObirOr5-Q1 [Ooceraea biroi]